MRINLAELPSDAERAAYGARVAALLGEVRATVERGLAQVEQNVG